MADELFGALGNLGQALNSTASIAGSAGASIRNALSMDDVQKGLVNAQKQIYDLQRGLQGTSVSAVDATRQFRALSSAFGDLSKSAHGYNLSLEDTAKMMHSFYSSVGGMTVVASKGAQSIDDLGQRLIKTFRDDAPGAAKNLMVILEKLPILQDAILNKSLSTSQMMTIYRQFGLEAMQFVQRWQAQTTPAMEQTQKLRDMFASLKAAGEQIKIKFQVDNKDQISAMIGSMKMGLKIAANVVAAPISAAKAVSIAPGAALFGLGVQATVSMLPRIIVRLWTSFTSLIGAIDRNTAAHTARAGGSGPPGTHPNLSGGWGPMPTQIGSMMPGAGIRGWTTQWNTGNIVMPGGRIYNRADLSNAVGSRVMGAANIAAIVGGAYAGAQTYSAGVRQRYTDIADDNGPSALVPGMKKVGALSGIGMGVASGVGAGLATAAIAGGPVGWVVGGLVAVGVSIYNVSKSAEAFNDAISKATAGVIALGQELDNIQSGYGQNWNRYFKGINSVNEQSDLAGAMLGQQRAYSERATSKWYKEQLADNISAKEKENIENFFGMYPEFAKALVTGDRSGFGEGQYEPYETYETHFWGNVFKDARNSPRGRLVEPFIQQLALNSLGDEAFSAAHAKKTGQPDWFQLQTDLSKKVDTINKLTTTSIPVLQTIYGQFNAMMQISQIGSGTAYGTVPSPEMGAVTPFTGGRRYRYNTEITGTWEGMLKIGEEQIKVIKEQIAYRKELLKLEAPGSASYNQSVEAVSSLSVQLAQSIRQQIDIGVERTLTRAQTQITEGRASSELASMGAGVDWMGGMRGGAPMWANITGAMGVSIAGMQQELDVMRDKIANPAKYIMTEKQIEEERQKAASKEVEIRRATLENQLIPLRMQGEYLGAESGSLKAIFDRIMSTSGYSTKDELEARKEMIAVAKDQAKWAKAQYEWYLKNGAPGGPSQVFQAYQAMVQAQQNVGLQEWETQKRQYEKSLMGLDFAESMRQLGLTKMQTLYRPMSEQMPLHLEGLDILREKIQEFANLMNMIADKDSPQWYDAATKLTNANKEYYSQLDYIRNSWEQQLTEMSFNLPTGSYTMGQEGPSKYQMFGSGYYTYRNLFNAPAESGGGIGSYDMLYGGFMGAGLAQLNRGQDMKSLIGGNTFGGATNSVLGGEMGPYLGPAGSAQPGRTATSANLERIISNDTNKYLKSIDKSLQTITAYSYTGY